jgi:hypothetical protein
MGYLQTKDYLRSIQPSELNAITRNDISIRQLVEGSVESEVRANLIQKFDLDIEFKDMQPFILGTVYKGGDRVYLDAAAYNPSTGQQTFATGELVSYKGDVYYCSTVVTAAEPFDTAKWTILGKQFDIYYIKLPQPLFEQDKFYTKGDQIFYKDKTYTALQDSIPYDQQSALQSESIEAIRKGNAVPGIGATGARMWGTGTAYSSTGIYPTATPWVKGDNRNQMFVRIILDMVIYYLCKGVAPNNVPEARHHAFTKAIRDLKDIADGELNAQLPTLKPLQGNRIRYGGKPREINSW